MNRNQWSVAARAFEPGGWLIPSQSATPPRFLADAARLFLPGLNKFILITCRLKETETNLTYNVTIFWEADRVTGPYRLVHYLRDLGPQTYFPNLPTAFIAPEAKVAATTVEPGTSGAGAVDGVISAEAKHRWACNSSASPSRLRVRGQRSSTRTPGGPSRAASPD